MKRASMTLLLLTFFLLFLALAPTYGNALVINPRTASSPADVQIDQVNHIIKIQDGGLVIINDTLKLSPKPPETEVLLESFSLGLPYKINDTEITDTLDYCFAYEASNPDERFEVELDVGLEGRIGIYGVNVIFPEPGLTVNNDGCDLTVVFVFSGLLSSETETSFNLDFPLYPSLTQNASLCNLTIILPQYANCTDSTLHRRGLNFTITTLDVGEVLEHTKSQLNSFQHEPAWLKFDLVDYELPIVNVDEVKREIKLDTFGKIRLTDSYLITNKADRIFSTVEIRLPDGAHRPVSLRDEFGDLPIDLSDLPNATVSFDFRTALEKDESERITLSYYLPWEKYVNQNGHEYDLTFTLFETFNWTIKKLTVTMILPEGAEFESSNPSNPYSVEKSVFQETVTFTFFKVTPFQVLDFNLTYKYLVFWASLYPTLWMGVLVIVVCAIALLWRAPRPPPVPIIPVPPEDLRSFVEAYEGKTGIILELELMEERLRKGKIPRRRYKVRKKMLEGRLSTLSRDLTGLREKIRAAGGKYANIMRQLEVAETMLEGVGRDIRRIEARYRRGEISKGAYRRLFQEYHRRRERAKTTIDEVLLRLREEL